MGLCGNRKAIFSKSNLQKDGVPAKPFLRMRMVVREFTRKNWRTKGDLSITLLDPRVFRWRHDFCLRNGNPMLAPIWVLRLHLPIVFFFEFRLFSIVSTFGIGLTL